MTFELNAIAQQSTLRILDCLVEGTLIAIFAALVLRVARLQNSGTRFAVWFSALVAIAALPLLGGAGWLQAAGLPAGSLGRPAITLPVSWALYLFAAWAAIAAWALLGVGRSLWHLHVLRQSCVPVDPSLLDARLRETLDRNQSPRPVALFTSDRVEVPTALGLAQLAVVVPDWVMRELSSDELNQILLHELAHLRRWDDWTNLAQKVVKALFFFHPAVWWIERRVSLEREMACDDAVLAETASPRAYAECLTHLAEKTLIQRSIALAQAALGRIRQTSLRVAQILDANRPAETRHAWKPAVSLVGVFAIALALCVSRAPRLIAFGGNEPYPNASAGANSSSSFSNIGRGGPASVAPVAQASASQAESRPDPVRLVQAKLTSPASRRTQQRAFVTRPLTSPLTSRPNPGSMLRQTNVRLPSDFTPVAFTETLFLVIEGRESGLPDQPVFEIQLWHVMVLHPVSDPNSTRTPPKQT